MNVTEFHAWKRRTGLRSWQRTATALGLPYRLVLRYQRGEAPIPYTVELACEGLEARLRMVESAPKRMGNIAAILSHAEATSNGTSSLNQDEIATLLLCTVASSVAKRLGINTALRSLQETSLVLEVSRH